MREVYVYDKESDSWSIGYGISGLEKGDVFGVAINGKPHADDEGYTAYRVLSDPYLLPTSTDSKMYCVDVQPLEDIEFKEEKIERSEEDEEQSDGEEGSDTGESEARSSGTDEGN